MLFFLVGYLYLNLVENPRTAGLDISYEFLGEPAGYDINQRLVEYNSQSSHWRASIVGVLNTLLVAFVGCILATIFGVTTGVLRLSNNWIVAKLMAVYVEIFRNVPVWLDHIINAIFLIALPQPRRLNRGAAIRQRRKFFGIPLRSQGVASMRQSLFLKRGLG